MKVLLCLTGLTAGAVTSAGLVALLSAIEFLPRIAGKTRTASHLMWYETVLALGCAAGNLVYLYGISEKVLSVLLIPFGLSAGIFTGSLVMALAETASVLPIFERRIHLREGLSVIVSAYALGKLAGAAVYFTKIR